MPAHTYLWLSELLAATLPELEKMPAGAPGQAFARKWFARLLSRFSERDLTTPYQQRNHVVSTRHAIRARFGDDHPSLEAVGFDEATWQKINQELSDKIEVRSENQRLLTDPERIVAKADELLGSTTLPEIACGLAVATGRRFSELLSGQSKYEPASDWSVFFTGQRKHKGDPEDFRFEIPTLAPAEHVLGAWGRLLGLIPKEVLTPHSINNRFNRIVNEAADAHFRGLVPPRLPAATPVEDGSDNEQQARERKSDALYLHLFRAVYATIAVHWFCPARVNRITYKAEIQGHRQILEAEGTMRRSYAASRHYDDYQIGDGKENIDGRQGIKLGKLPGLDVLTVFRKPGLGEDFETDEVPVIIAAPPVSTSFPSPTVTTMPTTPTQTPAPEVEKVPIKVKSKPGLYRIHAEDKAHLEESRAKVPDLNQPDHLRALLDLAANTESFKALAQRTQAAEAKTEEERRRADEVGTRLELLVAENKRLSDILRAIRPQPAESAQLNGVARELIDVALELGNGPLKDRLLALASHTLGGAHGSEPLAPKSAEPVKAKRATPTQPRVAPAPTTAPADAVAVEQEPAQSDAPELPEIQVPESPRPRASGRLGNAFKAIVDHNDNQPGREQKWAITESALHRLAGGNRNTIRSFFADHKAEIDAHHDKHNITASHNYVHGRNHRKIEEFIDARPAAADRIARSQSGDGN